MMMFATRRGIATALIVVLSACTAGASNDSLPVSRLATGVASGHKHKIKGRIRIVIPKRKHHRRILIHGHYVSPATQSIAIAVTPSAGGATQDFNADLTPASNPNCTTTVAQPLICTVAVTLGPGSYIGTFATYDDLLDGNGDPQGNELSGNQSVPFTFAPGQNNQILVTLEGVATGVAFVPDASATLSGNMASGYSLPKCSPPPQNVSVFGVDADDNYILGPGAPVPALVSDDTSDLPVTATPKPSAPNRFTLTPPAIPNGNAVVHLTASVTASTPSSGTGSGVADPTPANVTVKIGGTICGTFTKYSIPTSSSFAYGITAGPDGALWFTEFLGNKIGRITTDGSIAEYPVPTSSSSPSGIAAGPDGALWFTEVANNIGRITTGGSITEYPIPTANSRPTGIATGPDGALWFTECVGNKIGRITTDGSTITETTVPTYQGLPYGITPGPDGALWFTEEFGKIGQITTGGSVSAEYAVPSSHGYNSEPFAITTGPDGALWFTDCTADNIYRITTGGSLTQYPVPTSGSEPFAITTGPDGAVWFTEAHGVKVGRITTDGSITEYAIPNGGQTTGITTGPDGALWFISGNQIERLQ